MANSDDEDPDGLREAPPAGDGDGREGGGGEDGASAARDPMGPSTEGLQRPTGPEVSLGVVPEVEGEVSGLFSERCWATANFVFDEFGLTPHDAVASPSSVVPSLREMAIADPPGVQTFATLVLLPSATMGPLGLSSELGGSSSRPPLAPTREGGASSSAVPEATTSANAPLLVLPPIPCDILYAGVGLRQYRVSKVPLPDNSLSWLRDRPNDEVDSLLIFYSLYFQCCMFIYCVLISLVFLFRWLASGPEICRRFIRARCTTGNSSST